MGKDFLTIDGQKCRVECNWNAISDFLEITGQDSISALTQFGNIKPSELTTLMACALNEGARLDGVDVSFSPRDLGSKCDMSVISDFITIFTKQTSPKVAPKKA